MKYLLFILFCAAPLSLLTVNSCTNLLSSEVSGRQQVSLPPAQRIQQWRGLAEQHKGEDEQQTGQVLIQLEQATASPYELTSVTSALGENEVPLATPWVHFFRDRDVLPEIVAVLRDSVVDSPELAEKVRDDWDGWLSDPKPGIALLKPWLDQLKEEAAALTEAKGKLAATQEAGSRTDALQRIVDQRLEEVENWNDHLKRRFDELNYSATAHECMSKQDYAGCLKALENCSNPRSGPLGELYHKADFRRRAVELKQQVDKLRKTGTFSQSQWQAMIQAIQELVERDHPQPPTQEDSPAHETLQADLLCFQGEVAIQQLGPPESINRLSVWSQQASQIVSRYPCSSVKPTNKQKIGVLLRDWIIKGLPLKRTNERGFQFAVLKADQEKIHRGDFKPFGKFFFRVSGVNIPKDQFLITPRPPPTETVVEKYNDEVTALQRSRVAELLAWQGFERHCQEWTKELTEYKNIGGAVDYSLTQETNLAQAIIENWEDIGEFLEAAR